VKLIARTKRSELFYVFKNKSFDVADGVKITHPAILMIWPRVMRDSCINELADEVDLILSEHGMNG